MPGIVQRNGQFGNVCLSSVGSLETSGIWSKNRGGNVTFDQLQEFWSELSPLDRREILRIDKQTFFEQARKNLYCSRCNGFLLEGFSQIVAYGRSLKQEGVEYLHPGKTGLRGKAKIELGTMSHKHQDDAQDPSVHPWGGLVASRDGIITLLDCFLDGMSLGALQNVFDSGRARERERELLYPDACGEGGRGWICHGMTNYGRGHGIRETCALHTARIPCDTLVDFWYALGDDSQETLLRMKEEDFMERLMYRFASQRFCRDCRRNVIREFKELKELKRMRWEPCCNNWFCVAGTAFQCEVSKDRVLADWHLLFCDIDGTYHHFEWAIGTGEGKFDILEFEDVGMRKSAEVSGLDLEGVTTCFVTLRAWKVDGRCTNLTVKAHALKGQACVHRRLMVGDGVVAITRGESIMKFFEHAEEADEEEDDDSIDKDGNEFDAEGSRPQKHAKSPELAREFLLDAATVIFKEQVEKAFREGTARQNAHGIFVCLALKLLEGRLHVACKELITLQKQIKLLEEEEREKCIEEERREKKRTKEREKKLRRKERLKGREKDKKSIELEQLAAGSEASPSESFSSAQEEPFNTPQSSYSISVSEISMENSSFSSSRVFEQSFCVFSSSKVQPLEDDNAQALCRDGNGSSVIEQSKSTRRKLRFRKDSPVEQTSKWFNPYRVMPDDKDDAPADGSESNLVGHGAISSGCSSGQHRQSRNNSVKLNSRNCSSRLHEKFHSSNQRMRDRHSSYSCSRKLVTSIKDFKTSSCVVPASDRPISKTSHQNQERRSLDTNGILKGQNVVRTISSSRDAMNTEKVWEPTDGCPQKNPCLDVLPRPSACNIDTAGSHVGNDGESSQAPYPCKTSEPAATLIQDCSLNNRSHLERMKTSTDSFQDMRSSPMNSPSDPLTNASSTDNCSSCLSEGDSYTSSSCAQNMESSSTSDSEDTSFHSDAREISACSEIASTVADGTGMPNGIDFIPSGRTPNGFLASGIPSHYSAEMPSTGSLGSGFGRASFNAHVHGHHFLQMQGHNIHLPVFSAPPTVGYFHQPSSPWGAVHTNVTVPYPPLGHYVYNGSLGYDLSTNHSSHMHSNGLHPSTDPLYAGRLPAYDSMHGIISRTTEQNMASNLVGRQNASCVAGIEKPKTMQPPPSALPHCNGTKPLNPPKSQDDNSFSLFHYDGPMAAAVGCRLNPVTTIKDDRVGCLSSKSSPALAEAGTDCDRVDSTVEEYTLFAAKGGSIFSIF